jgi:hypothetical protein
MLATSNPSQGLFHRLRTGDVARAAAHVHEVDHRCGCAPLGELIQRRTSDADALSHPAILDGDGETEQAGLSQSIDGFAREAAPRIDIVGVGRDRLVGHTAHLFDYGGLLLVQTIQESSLSTSLLRSPVLR